ncbi:MAG: radical SAM protein [Clostridia bacterium]|nr:radical SAM protein [Clostridia bacterium]
MKLYNEKTVSENAKHFSRIMSRAIIPTDQAELKISFYPIMYYINEIGYREIVVSFFPMFPLLEKPQVDIRQANYILYAHEYALYEDASEIVLRDIKSIASMRKKGAEIIVIGNAANVEEQLKGSIENITFFQHHFPERLGEKFGLDMHSNYFIYNDETKSLNIFPVSGCLQHCKFCRNCYMHTKFESIRLEAIKENLDLIRKKHPEWLKSVHLLAENLTEYGIDIYGKPMLHKLLDLINSYEEVESIEFPVGMAIGEITPEILKSLGKLKKVKEIVLNIETGNNKLLSFIGKKHTKEKAIQVCNELRKAHPDIYIYTTVIIGLPTEQLVDMYELAQVIGKCKVDHVSCEYYTLAPRQPLAKLPQLSKNLKEYHLKTFIRALGSSLERSLELECEVITKNKNSRKAIRRKQRLEKRNQNCSFSCAVRQTITYLF